MGVRTPVQSNHICVDERGVAYIGDTRLKVMHIVMDKMAHGSTPEEYVEQHPGVATLAEVHAALAYYYDHQAELDQMVRREHEEYERLRAAAGPSPFQKRMRAEGRQD